MKNENRKKYARRIYEQTGVRYNDTKTGKRERYPIFDPLLANKNLIRELPSGKNRAWTKYRCPHCEFYLCTRSYQGWPAHECKGNVKGGWK